MVPWMGGGEMIQDVFLDHSTYAPPPARFEAGTPAIGEAIGLGAACDYLTGLGMAQVGRGGLVLLPDAAKHCQTLPRVLPRAQYAHRRDR